MPEPRTQVRFVVAPFLPAHQPALGVSSLLAVLSKQGYAADVKYLNIDYARRIGSDLHHFISIGLPTPYLLGDALFTRALWEDRGPEWEDYEALVEKWFERVRTYSLRPSGDDGGQWQANREALKRAYYEAPAVVKQWAISLWRDKPRIIGITSSFQQNAASLSLARQLRRLAPPEELTIIFGGANCEDDMGHAIADNFPFVDHVVSGEAEGVICGLVEKILGADGVAHQTSVAPRLVAGGMVSDLNALPVPNFDHYYEAIRGTYWEPIACLVAESSRGCWWGMKAHCTFCGLNGASMMRFRSKDPERFASEIRTLAEQYGRTHFAMTDNILDLKYLKSLLPNLIADGDEYTFFYETKSNLRKDQVELLAASGIVSLQPGIESFSTDILKLMAKGTTRLQNVQLLKWCAEFGVKVAWNFLYGFPLEQPAEYESMADLMPLLFHLPPPSEASRARMDRFAPYWNSPDKYGICNVRRYPAYDFVYGCLSASERERLAYYFEYDHASGCNPPAYAHRALEAVAEWRKAAQQGARLEFEDRGDSTWVIDTRQIAREPQRKLSPQERALLRLLDSHHSREGLHAASQSDDCLAGKEFGGRIAEFIELGWVIEEDGHFLSLVVDPQEYERVSERKVALRLGKYNINWPSDFPDEENRNFVRAMALQMVRS